MVFLLITFSASAQVAPPIAGKWRVVAVDNGVACDYRVKSMAISSAFLNTLTGNPDSLKILDLFIYVARSYENYIFYFHENNIYEEIKDGERRNPLASYHLNEQENIVTIRPATNDPTATEQVMMYDMSKEGILTLTLTSNDKKMMLTLEKTDE